MRPDIFLATIGRGSNGSNALEVTEDRAAVTAESQDNIINRVNNVSQYGPSWHYVPGIGVAGTAYAEVPGSALGDLAFTRASSKTRTNAAGVIETIGNNVPPHDYRNADGSLSTFPRLNLEPQRTNLILQSEAFDNASWVKVIPLGREITITANVATAPDGTTTADKMIPTAVNFFHCVAQTITTSGGQVTISAFAKAAENSFFQIFDLDTTDFANFDLTTGAVGSTQAYVASIQSAGNGWFRCSATKSVPSGSFTLRFGVVTTATAVRGQSFTGNGTDGLLIWGAQLEVGSYATTYIPTTTAAVTRIADAASKTGVSSLIGQTEGTLFADVNLDFRSGNTYFALAQNLISAGNYIGINFSPTLIRIEMAAGFTTQAVITFLNSSTGIFKIAFAYKQNDCVFYVNGTQIGTDTSATVPTCSQIGLFNYAETMALKYNQAALFTTRLPNATLAQMTTL